MGDLLSALPVVALETQFGRLVVARFAVMAFKFFGKNSVSKSGIVAINFSNSKPSNAASATAHRAL